MAQNIGTLISAAIRPNDSNDLIASAYASEIKGGLHVASASNDRDSIILQRRDWGMLCYVINDNQTYQLEYNYSSTNLTDNANWVVFNSGGGGGGSTGEWLSSAISFENTEPVSPNNGDRYIIDSSPSGVNWSALNPDDVVQYDSGISNWVVTQPTNGTSIRVDNEDNSIYRYEGNYPSGSWQKEKESQIRYITPTSINGASYSATSTPNLNQYDSEILFITKFGSTNTGATVSLNINSLGEVQIKKATGLSLLDFDPGDISINYPYLMSYDGSYFVITRPQQDNVSFNTQYEISPVEHITVPVNTQYWIYGDITVGGTLENYGRVVITNGTLAVTGSFINAGDLVLNTFAEIDGYGDTNYVPFWKSIYKLSATSSIYSDGTLVDITGNTFSVNTNNFHIPSGASNGYVLTSDSVGVATWQALPGSTIAKYSATQSLTAGVTYSVTHSLNTKDIIVNLWDEDTGELIIADTVRTSLNTVDINSAASINSRIVIIGG